MASPQPEVRVPRVIFDGARPLAPGWAPTSLPVGAILQAFVPAWRALPCSPWVLKVISDGYRLRFLELPPLTRNPVNFSRFSGEKGRIRKDLVDSLLAKRAIESVVRDSLPAFYSLLFIVPKASGDWRPVIDLSRLNLYLDIPTFRMDTAERIRSSLQQGDWTTSLDLQDAYFHIPIHPAHRKFLRFSIEERIFQFRVLPFGLATSPWLFTKVVLEVKKALHSEGIQIFMYLDDWLIVAESASLCALHTERVLSLCSQLGLLVNKAKSSLTPTRFSCFWVTRWICSSSCAFLRK